MLEVRDGFYVNPENIVKSEKKNSVNTITLNSGEKLQVSDEVFQSIIDYNPGGTDMYVMFDASVLDLDNGGTLTGLYNNMQELFDSGKPLLLCNVNYGSNKCKALFVSFVKYSSTFALSFVHSGDNLYLTISNDDTYELQSA